MDKQHTAFIQAHKNDDVHSLALKKSSFPGLDFDFILNQIRGIQKIKNKIPYLVSFEDIIYPINLSLEQCSSETTARYKANLCGGDILIDLTGGFGIDCLFMSAHFSNTVYVERNEALCEIVKHNYKILKLNNIEIRNDFTESFLSHSTTQADWIYIDPARRDSAGKKIVSISDCEPDVGSLLPKLLSHTKKLMIKLSPMMDISKAIDELKLVTEVHVVAVENECKELLLIVDNVGCKNVAIKTINFNKNSGNQEFEFSIGDESKSICHYTSKVDRYVYEPNAAVLKSGAFKSIAQRYNITKLHAHTHLYTSDELLADFPGRIFESIGVNESKEWQTIKHRHPQANLSIRNLPLTVDQLKKKLGIRDGGDVFLFGCTLTDGKKVIIECIKAKID